MLRDRDGNPGPVELRTRATDSTGRTQPDQVPLNDDGYLFWAVLRRQVLVSSTSTDEDRPNIAESS